MSTDRVFARAGDTELKARHYPPDAPNGWFLIDIHGGAWSSGSRKQGALYHEALAAKGFEILAIDFRDGRNARHPAACQDIAAAVRYVRYHHRPARLGLIGSSSGGHLALMNGLLPTSVEFDGTPFHDGDELQSGDGPLDVDAVIALWPVSNPLARFHYASHWRQEDPQSWGPMFAPDRLADGQIAYFGDEVTMDRAAIQHLLARAEHTALPPVFIVQPELDLNVPVLMSESLAGALRLRGGKVRYRVYPGVAHGFAARPGPQTDACIGDIIDFLMSLADG